jgi:putative FmdB family regulatory protein
MPTYEYRCTKGHTFEALQKMTDAPLKKCEVCGAKVERVLFPPTIHYKGTGFYSTDYGKGGKKKPADGKAETGAKESKKTDSSTKTESKASSTKSSKD